MDVDGFESGFPFSEASVVILHLYAFSLHFSIRLLIGFGILEKYIFCAIVLLKCEIYLLRSRHGWILVLPPK